MTGVFVVLMIGGVLVTARWIRVETLLRRARRQGWFDDYGSSSSSCEMERPRWWKRDHGSSSSSSGMARGDLVIGLGLWLAKGIAIWCSGS